MPRDPQPPAHPVTPTLVRVPVPPGTLSGLPGEGALLAWTVDDGSSSEVVARYVRFAADTGIRLTFFVTGSYPAWTFSRTHDFLADTFGADARPFFRPPFGVHNDRVDALAADIGYSVPTTWYGSLSDSGLITEQQVLDFAGTWFLPQHIVIGHLNFEPVTNVFPQLRALLHERGLTTVTLNDVFTSAAHP